VDSGGFHFDEASNTRDVFHQGTTDAGCTDLATLLGWDQELKVMDAERRAAQVGTLSPDSATSSKLSDPPSATEEANAAVSVSDADVSQIAEQFHTTTLE
jgi:hypothetical protein